MLERTRIILWAGMIALRTTTDAVSLDMTGKNLVLFNNSDGTEKTVKVYDTMYYAWVAPQDCLILQFTFTASGAVDNGGSIVPQLFISGNQVWQTYASFTLTAPHTFDLSSFNFTVKAGQSVLFRWTTLTTYLYFNCLETSGGIPVISIKYQLPETTSIQYSNADGTESIATAYDTVSASWTAPTDGKVLQFTMTASGAINDGGFVEPQILVAGSLIWQTFASFTSAGTQTFNVSSYEITATAGQPIVIRWTTLSPDRYFSCLARSDGVPVVQIIFQTTFFARESNPAGLALTPTVTSMPPAPKDSQIYFKSFEPLLAVSSIYSLSTKSLAFAGSTESFNSLFGAESTSRAEQSSAFLGRPMSQTSSFTSIDTVTIVQFKVAYLLSEITDDVRRKMVMAIANIINVNVTRIVLSFTELDMRRRHLLQSKLLLVNVGLLDFQGSASVYTTVLSQDKINEQMASLGLKNVQVAQAATTNIMTINAGIFCLDSLA